MQNKYSGKGLEITITRIKLLQLYLVIIGVYRPPSARGQWFETFREMIQEIIPFGKLVLMGDFNCDLLKTNSATTKSLLSILEFGNLIFKPEIKLAPTRITKSTASCIDLIVVDWSLPLSR